MCVCVCVCVCVFACVCVCARSGGVCNRQLPQGQTHGGSQRAGQTTDGEGAERRLVAHLCEQTGIGTIITMMEVVQFSRVKFKHFQTTIFQTVKALRNTFFYILSGEFLWSLLFY